MEDILKTSEKEITQLVKQCEFHNQIIKYISEELFSDKINLIRIAYLLAFVKKLVEKYPDQKHALYEDVFNSIYSYIKF